jgi:hypothetical protein
MSKLKWLSKFDDARVLAHTNNALVPFHQNWRVKQLHLTILLLVLIGFTIGQFLNGGRDDFISVLPSQPPQLSFAETEVVVYEEYIHDGTP